MTVAVHPGCTNLKLGILFYPRPMPTITAALVGPLGRLRSILEGTEPKIRDEPHAPRDDDHSDWQIATSVRRKHSATNRGPGHNCFSSLEI